MISQADMTTTTVELSNLPNFLHFKPHTFERQTMATFSFPSKPLPLSCAFETTKKKKQQKKQKTSMVSPSPSLHS